MEKVIDEDQNEDHDDDDGKDDILISHLKLPHITPQKMANLSLERALMQQNFCQTKWVVNRGADVKICTRSGSALHLAARFADVSFMEYLLSLGALVNARDENGRTPLHILLKPNFRKQCDKVYWLGLKVLVTQGADIYAVDRYGFSPVHYAALYHDKILEPLIVEHEADPNLRNSISLEPLLHSVICFHRYASFEILLKNGADPFILDARSRSGLHHATDAGEPKIVMKLIEEGLDPNAKDMYGRTPVFHLRSSHNSDCIRRILKVLLDYIDINIFSPNGRSVLELFREDLNESLVLRHIAKLQALDCPVDDKILKYIEARIDVEDYFEACRRELARAKTTKVYNDSWVTYFNLLVDDESQLIMYAGNPKLTSRYYDLIPGFFHYGETMSSNMTRAIHARHLREECAQALSDACPILHPCHLIVSQTLHCFEEKDLEKFLGITTSE